MMMMMIVMVVVMVVVMLVVMDDGAILYGSPAGLHLVGEDALLLVLFIRDGIPSSIHR